MAQKWVSMSQACVILGISRRTLARWVSEGKVKSKKVEDRRFVLASEEIGQDVIDEDQVSKGDDMLTRLEDEIKFLREELERKDTIILSMTKQVEKTQLMLEEYRGPFWKRWFRCD